MPPPPPNDKAAGTKAEKKNMNKKKKNKKLSYKTMLTQAGVGAPPPSQADAAERQRLALERQLGGGVFEKLQKI